MQYGIGKTMQKLCFARDRLVSSTAHILVSESSDSFSQAAFVPPHNTHTSILEFESRSLYFYFSLLFFPSWILTLLRICLNILVVHFFPLICLCFSACEGGTLTILALKSYFSSVFVRHTRLLTMSMLPLKASKRHCNWSHMMVSDNLKQGQRHIVLGVF